MASEPTDKTIEIECGECNVTIEGLELMVSHIIEFHPSYSLHEAAAFAEKWLEAAYDKHDEHNYNQLSSSQKRAYRADQNGG